MYAPGRASTCRYRPYSVCTPNARVYMPLDVHPSACTCPFQCVHPVYVCVRLWTCIHVSVPAFIRVYALCTCVYASGRVSTYRYQPFSVCKPSARVCRPLDVHPRACTGLFQCLRPVHVCVHLWTCIHVSVLALFAVYTLFISFARASTCRYRPFLVCTPCLCVCAPLDVHPRA